jgi:hypothetical protein
MSEIWIFVPDDGNAQEMTPEPVPDLSDPGMVVSTAEMVRWLQDARQRYPDALEVLGQMQIFLLGHARKPE